MRSPSKALPHRAQVATLAVSALALASVGLPLLRLAIERLVPTLGTTLWPARPALAAGTVAVLLGLLVAAWRRERRHRQAGDSPGSAAVPADAAPGAFESNLGAAMIGFAVARAVLGGSFPVLSPFVPASFALAHPNLAGLADAACVALVAAWLFLSSGWRVVPQPGDAAATFVRLQRAFRAGAGLLATLLLCAWGLSMLQRVVVAWIDHLPWTGYAAALAALFAVVDSLLDWRRRPAERADVLRTALQSQLWCQAIGAALVLIVALNIEGMRASAALFAQAHPAVRLAAALMPALFLAVVLIVVGVFALQGRRVRVFISFQHSREQSAVELGQALSAAGLRVRRIPFRADYQHDQLLQSIQDEIRRCDVMVCLPGAQPSFVENEVLVASTLRKFIVFVVGEREPRLPNTAYYGYPVFRLERVSRRRWRAVVDLIQLVTGHWRASLRFLVDSWSRLLDDARTFAWVGAVFVGGSYLAGIVLAAVDQGGAGALAFLTSFHRIYLALLGDWIPLWVWFNVFLIGCVFALINLWRTRRVLRQETLTGHLTHALLRKHLGPGRRVAALLASMWKTPPAAEHESAQAADRVG